jgi:hypothetical protein
MDECSQHTSQDRQQDTSRTDDVLDAAHHLRQQLQEQKQQAVWTRAVSIHHKAFTSRTVDVLGDAAHDLRQQL